MNSAAYLIQVNIYLTLFYIFYTLVLQNETFFKWNRTFLVSSSALSFFIPLMQSHWIRDIFVTKEIVQVSQIIYRPVTLSQVQIQPIVVNNSFTIAEWITIIYTAGALIYFLKFIWQVSRVRKSFHKGNHAHSFFKKIKVSEHLPSRESIVKHEEIHASQLHSADIIFFEIISIINWFNPVVYGYKKSVKYIHEFIADEAAAEDKGKKEYALLLVSETFGIQKEQLANNFFNHSLLKKRIMMLYKTKSQKIALLKYGLSAPLFALMVILSSATISKEDISDLNKVELTIPQKILNIVENTAQNTIELSKHNTSLQNEGIIKWLTNSKNDPTDPKVQSRTPQNTIVDNDSTIVDIAKVEVQPQYPGGVKEFLNWLASHKELYTPEAKAAGKSGRVVASFVIEKDGSLTNIKVIQDRVGYGTKEAVIQVLKTSKHWNPGIQNGNPVRVQFVIPIMLTSDQSPADGIKTGKVPLIIIDGKASDISIPANFNFMTADEEEYSTLFNIKESDIKDITMLKDQALLAKYGPQGINGVMLINTKARSATTGSLNGTNPDSIPGNHTNTIGIKLRSTSAGEPLYILDGKQITRQQLSVINAKNIENITVVKGKEQTALYGEKAGNGVVLITSAKK